MPLLPLISRRCLLLHEERFFLLPLISYLLCVGWEMVLQSCLAISPIEVLVLFVCASVCRSLESRSPEEEGQHASNILTLYYD